MNPVIEKLAWLVGSLVAACALGVILGWLKESLDWWLVGEPEVQRSSDILEFEQRFTNEQERQRRTHRPGDAA